MHSWRCVNGPNYKLWIDLLSLEDHILPVHLASHEWHHARHLVLVLVLLMLVLVLLVHLHIVVVTLGVLFKRKAPKQRKKATHYRDSQGNPLQG